MKISKKGQDDVAIKSILEKIIWFVVLALLLVGLYLLLNSLTRA
jgi:hypothetical protein